MSLPPLKDREWLLREYEERGRSTASIAKDLGCAHTTVSRALQDLGITVRPAGYPPPMRIAKLQDHAWLRAQAARRTQADIAAELGCATTAVGRARMEMNGGNNRKWRGRSRTDTVLPRLTRDYGDGE